MSITLPIVKGLTARWRDALALGVVALLGLTLASVWLRQDLFIYGDHPGQFFKAWYLSEVQFPQRLSLFDWNPYWYAGYPELQFNPPGYALVTLALKLLSLGLLSTTATYELCIILAFVLPGLTFYYALRHLNFPVTVAFFGGLFGIVFPAIVGGYYAAIIGMLGSRLSFGLDALVFAWGITALRTRGLKWTLLTVGVLALEIFTHLYHGFGIWLALALYAVAFDMPRARAVAHAIFCGLGAAAIAALWILPLLAYTSFTVPTMRSTFDQSWRQFVEPVPVLYYVFAIVTLVIARRWLERSQEQIVWTLALLMVVTGGSVFAGHLVLVERLSIYTFDPVRFIGEFYFALIMLAAIGAGTLAQRIGRWVAPDARSAWVGTGLAGCITAAFVVPMLLDWNQFWTRTREPFFLSDAVREYKLDVFWTTLRAEPGRVLFTSSTTRLQAQGGEFQPTTLAALSPQYTGREIIGGTFTHWSPIAAALWIGESHPPVLRGLVEENDGVRLFGVEWEQMQDRKLLEWCRRLDITTIVATADDFTARTMLDASPLFQSYYNNGLYFVYRVKDNTDRRAEAADANVRLSQSDPFEMRIQVRDAKPGAVVNVKTFYYPRWQIEPALPLRGDRWGLMRIEVPNGGDTELTLRYGNGAVEWVGNSVSAAALLAYIAGWLWVLQLGKSG